MGIVAGIIKTLFGGGTNVLRETVEVFRENAEADASRDQELRIEVLNQYAREFEAKRDGLFDRIMDGVNRLPRPALALGTLLLFTAAMIDPIWFAARMQGIALVPEPLWWLLGVIVSFYFGARHQVKSQEFQRSIATTMARTPQAVENISALRGLRAKTPGLADTGTDSRLGFLSLQPENNAALSDWHNTTSVPATK